MSMKKGVLLYTCYNGYNNTKYYTPTDAELASLLETTDEILFIPIVTYNRFTDRNGNDYEVLSHEKIDAMTVDMVGDPSRFETIKGEYHATANHRLPANYHVKDYVNDASALASRIVAIKSDAKLWFSVPSAECFHAVTHFFANAWADTVDLIKATVSEKIWNDNVKGIYYAGEDIVTAGYTVFDNDQPEKCFNNPIVYSMKTVSDRVHSYGKEMLWIPYYHEAASSSKNLGHVVNLTDIFDTVIIQPSFFFNAARTEEIRIVSDCVRKQAVVDINGHVIGGKKTSKTEIGFEMEIDSQFFNKEGYPERYYAYEKGFGEFVGKRPTAYYAGAPETMLRLTELMGEFLNK
ncbi:MAG: DUF4855 domain-containing protein [Clostridia bacterium]|nr:DUF4855 domain-containing protein [Clostridia bacterium]